MNVCTVAQALVCHGDPGPPTVPVGWWHVCPPTQDEVSESPHQCLSLGCDPLVGHTTKMNQSETETVGALHTGA